MKTKKHKIKEIIPGSIAEEMGLEPGDSIIKINGQEIDDIFDYRYLIQDEYIEVTVLAKSGEECRLEIEKDFGEDLGAEFENGLMDEYRSCRNKCIFCFIDQMPKGMRDTLYFKDDDSRLSFLQGNYVTLTNMSEHDLDRIIRYRLSPINISFQTTNPELRCRMLHNRFAGEALRKVDRLYEAGIEMNGQIVLCKGVNDGEELERSISDLTEYLPYLKSVSVVPVGLSKFREGLYPLEPFTKEEAEKVIDSIECWQNKLWKESGLHFIHASDEWYILADRQLPEAERYDGYLQLENGVGMLRLLLDEFQEALAGETEIARRRNHTQSEIREISIATGKLAYPYLCELAAQVTNLYPEKKIHVYEITNRFFGEQITVSGLLTGRDLINQLQGRPLGKLLLLPENMLRSDEDVFLDDITLPELEKTLQVSVNIVKSSGYDLLSAMLGRADKSRGPRGAGYEIPGAAAPSRK